MHNQILPLRFLPSTQEMWCYNSVIADARMPTATDIQSRCSILSPELALPSGSHATTTRSHGALHVLGTPKHLIPNRSDPLHTLSFPHCILLTLFFSLGLRIVGQPKLSRQKNVRNYCMIMFFKLFKTGMMLQYVGSIAYRWKTDLWGMFFPFNLYI